MPKYAGLKKKKMAVVMSNALQGNGIFCISLLYVTTRQRGNKHLRDGVVCGLLCTQSQNHPRIISLWIVCIVFLSLQTARQLILGLFFTSCFLGQTYLLFSPPRDGN